MSFTKILTSNYNEYKKHIIGAFFYFIKFIDLAAIVPK